MFSFFSGGGAQRISPQEAVAKAKAGEMLIVDVRDASELAFGKAEGAIHIPLNTIREQVDPNSPSFNPALDLSKAIGIYCASGARSGMAVQVFKQAGFSEVYNLGGLGHWQQGGGKIVPG
ncbi:MAG: sulfurtransferase [Rhodobacterales bacterium]|nr:MAG: sulfurtransferase [Rhodobacterales bacterium]